MKEAYLLLQKTRERFWLKVNKHGPVIRPRLGRCWLWMAGKFQNGYGAFSFQRTTTKAHRVAFFYANGHLPLIGRHRCDVKPCCRPSHVLDGTVLDNVKDRDRRNRTARGECAGFAKLKEPQVLAILADNRAQRVIASDFGVCKSTIGYIKRRENWRHVEVHQ